MSLLPHRKPNHSRFQALSPVDEAGEHRLEHYLGSISAVNSSGTESIAMRTRARTTVSELPRHDGMSSFISTSTMQAAAELSASGGSLESPPLPFAPASQSLSQLQTTNKHKHKKTFAQMLSSVASRVIRRRRGQPPAESHHESSAQMSEGTAQTSGEPRNPMVEH